MSKKQITKMQQQNAKEVMILTKLQKNILTFKQETTDCFCVPPTSSFISAAAPTSPIAPHWIARDGNPSAWRFSQTLSMKEFAKP